ncbi:chromosome segregation protein SMC [Anaerosinus sp.]
MQLRKLESYGFKSFADKVELDFDMGVTAIVGPNGSGKSNITDAIRWALGEQNIRNLRGVKTEDVIFSGSSNKRASGVAEVSLIFDNSDGVLPLEYQEVVVTRRIFRSGESEFYINKVACRLKDIHQLFFDTGLGKDAMSVISQNKVDQILNSRPEERRAFFEEVAGITKYRTRQKDSIRKLTDTEQNILRVTDILNELEIQCIPLKESANKTRQYNLLFDSLQNYKIKSIKHEFLISKKKLNRIIEKKDSLNLNLKSLENLLTLNDVDKTKFNNEILEIDTQLKGLNEYRQEISFKIEKNKNCIIIAKDRIVQAQNSLDHTTLEITQKKADLEALKIKSKMLADDSLDIESKLKITNEELRILENRQENIEKAINHNEKSLGKYKEDALINFTDLMEKRNKLNLIAENMNSAQVSLNKINQELINFSSKRSVCIYNTRFINSQVNALKYLILQKEGILQKTQEQTHAFHKELDEVEEKNKKTKMMLIEKQNRFKFLTSLQENYDGFNKAVRLVLKSQCAWRKDICGVIAELIKVPAEYITAIEVALGGNLQNIITMNELVAKQAIAFLKKEKVGRVTFLPLNLLQVNRLELDRKILQIPGVIGLAHQLVSFDVQYKKAVENLLGRTLVVDSIDTALKIIKTNRIRIVTLGGEVINPSGAISGGSSKKNEMDFFNRLEEIKKLDLLIKDLCTENEKLDTLLIEKKGQIDRNFFSMEKLKEKLNAYYLKQETLKINSQKVVDDLKNIEEKNQILKEELQNTKIQMDQLEKTRKIYLQEIGNCEEQIKNKNKQNIEIENTLANLKSNYESENKNLLNLKIECNRLKGEFNNKNLLKNEYKRNEDQLVYLIEELSLKLFEFQGNQKKYQQEIEQEELVNNELKLLETSVAKDYSNYYQIKLSKLAQIQENDKNAQKLRKNHNEIKEELYKLDIDFMKYNHEVNTYSEKLKQEYSLIDFAEDDQDACVDIKEVQDKINNLELSIKELGPINPNAISEYDALQSRYSFMKKQSEDLIVAKNYLLGIIKDMNIAMTKQFKMAFEAINDNFQKIYIRLFGGGQAKLALIDEDILESGIEIYVQPPDKKMRNLSLLSGGERALTVIALLFAFLAFRPSPFVVLDEVDAALDEANLKRFSEFLRDYSIHTQFVVVTHRKGTMEAADTMHGVTVDDTGISKIISVKLEEA